METVRKKRCMPSSVAYASGSVCDLVPKCAVEDIFNLPLTEDYLVVDTRSAEEFAASHLPNTRSFSTFRSKDGLTLEACAAMWVATEMDSNPPEQTSRAAILGDPANRDNQEVMSAVARAISRHPRFQSGNLHTILLLDRGHDAVVEAYPFLDGKEWSNFPVTYPSQVQAQLYLGSETAARSKLIFEHLRIGAVVNAAKELQNYHADDETVSLSYLNLDLEDDPDQELAESIGKVLPFITNHIQEGRSVLVHCKMGQSRSVSMVLAYLMSSQGCGYDKAFAQVRRARPLARPNQGFVAELRSLEGRLVHGWNLE